MFLKRSLALLSATLTICLTQLLALQPGYAQPASLQSWLHFDPKVAPDWQVAAVAGDPLSALITPRSETRTASRHVLVLLARPSSAYDLATSEAVQVLGEKVGLLDFTVVNYAGDEARAAAAVQQAERDRVDIILAMGSEATAWLWANYRGGHIAVVSVCAKDPVMLAQATNYNEGTHTNFALTSLNLPADVQMAYALKLMPRLRNLAILVDSQNVSAVETQAQPLAAQAQSRGIRVLDLRVKDPAHAAEELRILVSEAVKQMQLNDINLENSLFLVTGSTSVFNELATINANSSRVPVISMVPETVHAGPDTAVLSIGVSFRSNAHLAAVYAAEIVQGKSRPGDLKVGVVTPPDIAINFRRSREIGLRIPFQFFESASSIFNYEDKPVRSADTKF